MMMLRNTRRFTSVARPPVTQFSEEEEMLRESVAKFASERIAPHVLEMDESQEMRPEIIKECFEQGFMGIETDEKYGGAGMSFTSACIVIEELAKVDPSVSVMVDVQNTLVNIGIRTWGTESQKQQFLPRLASDTLGSFCLSEAGSGSDAFSMQTSAKEQADGSFVLNGTKSWITNAQQAGLFIVMATEDPGNYKGITAFIVDGNTPGLSLGKKENKLGIRASSTCEVVLDNVVVPAENILGTRGKGYKMAIESLNEGRIGIGAQMLGLAKGAFNSTLPYLKDRKQFGQSLSSFQGMQFQISTMYKDISAAEVLVYNAARMKEAGLNFVTEASIAKLFAADVAGSVSAQCVDCLGGVGFTKDFPAEKFYRDSRIGQIYEGTRNIQLQTIAKDLLKD